MIIEPTLDRIRRFWSGSGPRRMLSVCSEPSYRQLPNAELMVSKAVECIQSDLTSGQCVLPTFIPDFGTVSIPALWGGRRIPAIEGGAIHIEPVAHHATDLEHLPAPHAFEHSDFNRAISLYRQVCDRLERDDIFLRTPDLQGPMNTLGLLCEQTELMVALYDAPELIHQLLGHITDTTIEYLRLFRTAVGKEKVIGNVWPWIVLPDGNGVAITQDFMPLLSPDLYAEFELPQLKRIADAFGGVFIHCCGEYAHHLPALAKADFKIWGLEVHYPCTKLWDVHSAMGDDLVYVPYIAPTGTQEFDSIDLFLNSLNNRSCKNARIWVCVAREWLKPDALEKLQLWATA